MKYIIGGLAIAVGAFAITLILNIGLDENHQNPFARPGNDYPVNRFHENTDTVKYSSTGEIRFVHRVTWDNKEKLYVYFYRIEHKGTEEVFVNWQVLDFALASKKAMIVKLDANANQEITFKSTSAPRPLPGSVVLFTKHHHPAIPNSLWRIQKQLDTIVGPVPIEQTSNSNSSAVKVGDDPSELEKVDNPRVRIEF